MHQVAQKFSSTTRLASVRCNLSGVPSSLVNWTFGAAWIAVLLTGVRAVVPPAGPLRTSIRDSKFGIILASRELDKSVTRLLITSAPIKIRMTPETTSTLCRCWRNFE
mgnify:CR=1 FL=1